MEILLPFVLSSSRLVELSLVLLLIILLELLSLLPIFFKVSCQETDLLKNAPKAILKIKHLLQSYALARVHVRFSLKILKTGKCLMCLATVGFLKRQQSVLCEWMLPTCQQK